MKNFAELTLRVVLVVFLLCTAVRAGAQEIVFGPRTYSLASGKPQQFVERFEADPAFCGGKAAFLLTIENTDVSSATVSVNGLVIAAEADFKPPAKTIRRVLRLVRTNETRVELKGGRSGASLEVSIVREIDQPVAERSYGLTQPRLTATESVSVADPGARYVLTFESSDVRSGSIRFNGNAVMTDEIGRTPLIRREVFVQTVNTIEIDLHGDRGASAAVALKRVSSAACGPQISISSPAAGAQVVGMHVLVRGTVAGPRNLGVVVNGTAAEIDLNAAGSDGDPYPWHALLEVESGLQVIRATASDPAGASTEVGRQVNVIWPSNPVSITPLTASGVAPLAVTFQLDAERLDEIVRHELDLDGDGTYETNGMGAMPETVEHEYITPGTRVVSLRVTLNGGAQVTSFAGVTVMPFSVMNALLRATWSDFVGSLRRGDVPAALGFLAGADARAKYEGPLTLLGPHVSDFADAITTIKPASIGAGVAHYLLIREVDGVRKGFHVYFVRDERGIWRITQF